VKVKASHTGYWLSKVLDGGLLRTREVA